MKVLQLTDPHLYGSATAALRGVQTDASLHAVLDAALTRVPEYAAMLVTGDLVQDDRAGYLRFRSILGNLDKPVLCIPGNHDEPEAMRRELAEPPFRLGGAHRFGAWKFVMLDSYDPGNVGGLLSDAELARLDAELGADPDVHAMVCLHHHPVATGSHWLDGIGLANATDFWRVLDAHHNVRAAVWGHVHQEFDGIRGAVQLFATPSTGAQFRPRSEKFTLDARPPGYRSFELHADGRIDSQVHWVTAMGARMTGSA